MTRASDRERERALDRLARGWAEGALSTDTFETRLGLALQRRSRRDLRALTWDVERGLRGFVEALAPPAPPMPAAPVLRITEEEHEIVLGRSRTCSRVFDDESISRRHTMIRRTAEGLVVQDLGSTNGTWVNGVRVEGPARVSDGDLIVLGRLQLLLRAA